MDLENLTLKEIREIQALIGGKKSSKKVTPINMGIRIAVLQRGWVVVGEYIQTGNYIELKKAAVVRKWGTTKGLPELALCGPLNDTVLDKGPDMRFHALTEIVSIKCDEGIWVSKL
jgi:hypothetical protein